MREWRRLGHPLPVYFTVEELSDAADVFPIEFHQMANARIVLYGHDPFEFVKLSNANLRHQTEYELRSKLIQLRRLYIPASVSIPKVVRFDERQFVELRRAVSRGADPAWSGGAVAKPDCVRATASFASRSRTVRKNFRISRPAKICPRRKKKQTIFSVLTCCRLNK